VCSNHTAPTNKLRMDASSPYLSIQKFSPSPVKSKNGPQHRQASSKRGSIEERLPVAAKRNEMNFQRELRNSKQVVRSWVRANFSDQKLASVAAFNADGKMSFRNPCGCLMGVTYSDRLHVGQECNRKHYWRARRQDLTQTHRLAALFLASRIGKAEKAYNLLGLSASLNSCFGDDELRRRRFSALLRAEMRRREELRTIAEYDQPAQPAFAETCST
jgi:hypothetical protein